MLQTAKCQDIQQIKNLYKCRKKGTKMTKKKLLNDSSKDKTKNCK